MAMGALARYSKVTNASQRCTARTRLDLHRGLLHWSLPNVMTNRCWGGRRAFVHLRKRFETLETSHIPALISLAQKPKSARKRDSPYTCAGRAAKNSFIRACKGRATTQHSARTVLAATDLARPSLTAGAAGKSRRCRRAHRWLHTGSADSAPNECTGRGRALRA